MAPSTQLVACTQRCVEESSAIRLDIPMPLICLGPLMNHMLKGSALHMAVHDHTYGPLLEASMRWPVVVITVHVLQIAPMSHLFSLEIITIVNREILTPLLLPIIYMLTTLCGMASNAVLREYAAVVDDLLHGLLSTFPVQRRTPSKYVYA